MAFDATRFLFSRALIERQGLAAGEATRLAVLPSVIQMPLAQSVVLATAIGQREAPPPPPPAEVPAPHTTEVPDVVGTTVVEAIDQLRYVGLSVGVELGDVDPTGKVSRGPGRVLSVDPEAGSQVAEGTWVTLEVALRTTVPEVGKNLADTLSKLAQVGLAGVPEEVASHEMSLEPAEGTSLVVGATVVIKLPGSQHQ